MLSALSSLGILPKKRDQRRRQLHQLTYRLGARKVLEERSKATMIFVLGFAYLSALTSQLAHGGFFGLFGKTIGCESATSSTLYACLRS